MSKRQGKSGSTKKKRNPNPIVRQYAGQVAQLKRRNAFLVTTLGAIAAKTDAGKVYVTESDYRLMQHAQVSIGRDEHGRTVVGVEVPEEEGEEPEAAE